ncbi:hypothetical protein GCM10007094_40360 [Pseudovibrio japonicus]|uniref:Methyltransferase type 12 domain-containing protein n=1 Tax=Pseudovibrio japonicus TaxID=366534 RepID=A0ABQ3ERN2_9HYPH|nr:class I SAM-dependent methyltransferase [Pseudovibrio japonicus]GHB46911.1 hypothetical protein GCM10007094_40360 [Pseudovibrio japonicus]
MPDCDNKSNSYEKWINSKNPYFLLELHSILSAIGNVEDLDLLDVACGEGRLSRLLLGNGAKSVLGIDVSQKMISEARAQEFPGSSDHEKGQLRYEVVSACDEGFQLDRPVDMVTALYLFHYANSMKQLEEMCQFISRNLKPGGRFVTYGINPEFDFTAQDPRIEKVFGFRYEAVAPPEYLLVIGDLRARMWHWSKAAHEKCLTNAGFENIRWLPLKLPEQYDDHLPNIDWFLENPSCIVLEAEKR